MATLGKTSFLLFSVLLSVAPARATPAPPYPPHPLVVGYLPQWGLYTAPAWTARDLVTSGAAPLLDQIDYAQATVRDGHCVIADPEADLNHVYSAAMSVDGRADLLSTPFRGGMHQLQLLRARYPRIRTVISLEGKAANFAQAAQPATRAAFVRSCVEMFMQGHLAPGVEAPGLFDGIDLDWEFPQTPDDGANYMALLAEFRRQLDAAQLLPQPVTQPATPAPTQPAAQAPARPPVHMLLTVAAGPGTRRYPGVDWAQVGSMVDEVGLMNYDYSGPWQQQTGMLAPLFPMEGAPPNQGTVAGTVEEYEAVGVPAAKLLLGVPFYGYHWQGVAATGHGLFQAGQSVREDTPYHDIAGLAPKSTLYRDTHAQTPWLFDGTTFWTFDDPTSAREKAAYAAAQGLRGVMVWELSGDTGDSQLLHAIAAGLAQPARAPTAASR